MEADLTTKSRCKMQSSEEEEEEERESLSPSNSTMRGEEGGGRVFLLRSTTSLPLPLLPLSTSSLRSSPLRLCRSSYRRCPPLQPPARRCCPLTTSFDSFFLSASTRECVKQNETRVPAPCRLTRLDPSFRPLVPRERIKKTLPRSVSPKRLKKNRENPIFFPRNLSIFPRTIFRSREKKRYLDRYRRGTEIRFSFLEI